MPEDEDLAKLQAMAAEAEGRDLEGAKDFNNQPVTPNENLETDRRMIRESQAKLERMRSFTLTGDLMTDARGLMLATGRRYKVEGNEDPQLLVRSVAALREAISNVANMIDGIDLNNEAKRLMYVDEAVESIRQFDKFINNYQSLLKATGEENEPAVTPDDSADEGQQLEETQSDRYVYQRSYARNEVDSYRALAVANQLKGLRNRAGLIYIDQGHKPTDLESYLSLVDRVAHAIKDEERLRSQAGELFHAMTNLDSDRDDVQKSIRQAKKITLDLLHDFITAEPELAKHLVPGDPTWSDRIDKVIQGNLKIQELMRTLTVDKTVH